MQEDIKSSHIQPHLPSIRLDLREIYVFLGLTYFLICFLIIFARKENIENKNITKNFFWILSTNIRPLAFQ